MGFEVPLCRLHWAIANCGADRLGCRRRDCCAAGFAGRAGMMGILGGKRGGLLRSAERT
jgi:hypothetical protein